MNGPYRADVYDFDSQAFGLGYMNEPYRLKSQRNPLLLSCVKAG
jgi:hypothetical protein